MLQSQGDERIEIIVLCHHIPYFLATSQAAVQDHPPLFLVVIQGNGLHQTPAIAGTVTWNLFIDMSRKEALHTVVATARLLRAILKTAVEAGKSLIAMDKVLTPLAHEERTKRRLKKPFSAGS